MRSRAVVPLLIGLCVGIFAIKMFVNVLRNARGAGNTAEVAVVVANADIAPSMKITETMLSIRKVPEEFKPKMGFEKMEDIVDRVASVAIANGTPITANALAPEGTPAGLSVRIPKGYRAVSIKIDEYAGVAGWIKPQTRVDVIAMMVRSESGRRETLSRTILQDVEVLAVGQDAGNTGDPTASVTKSVTLLVKPDEVPRLHLAASESGSKLRLSMRGMDDRGLEAGGLTTDNELSNASAATAGGAPDAEQMSIISRLFSKRSKNNADAADKAEVVNVNAASDPVALVSAEQSNDWVVEVILGNSVHQVAFDGDGSSARRLDPKAKRSSPLDQSAALLGASRKGSQPTEPILEPDEPVEAAESVEFDGVSTE